jgi:hypothetical protein
MRDRKQLPNEQTTNRTKGRDSVKEQNSQQGSASKTGNDKEGDFLMVVSEVIDSLIGRGFCNDEKSIIVLITKKTIGQQCEFRQIPTKEFIEKSGASRSQCFGILKRLVDIGAVNKKKKPGQRGFYYGLNIEYFGRTNSGQIKNVYYPDKFKVQQSGHSRYSGVDVKGAQPCTQKPSRAALGKNSANPSYIPSYILSYLSKELRDFAESRSINTKKRWTNLINDIISKNPEDQSCLMLAIETVQKTNKDFLGNPIRSSMLRLFEETEWDIIKSILLSEAKKKDERKNKERMINQTRIELQNEKDITSPEEVATARAKIHQIASRSVNRLG